MAEENDRYSVLVVDVDGIPGGPEGAASRLAKKFKMPLEVAEQLVASVPAVVKRDVGRDEADRYAAALRALGAASRVVRFRTDTGAQAAVTGILKPRRSSSSLGAAARDAVRTSGAYMSVKKRGAEGEAVGGERGDAIASDTVETRPIDESIEDTIVVDVDAADWALPVGVAGGAKDAPAEVPSAIDAPHPPVDESAEDPFDIDAFALPSSIGRDRTGSGPAAGSEDFASRYSGDFGAASADFAAMSSAGYNAVPASFVAPLDGDEEEDVPAPPPGRPNAYDELMAMGDSSSQLPGITEPQRNQRQPRPVRPPAAHVPKPAPTEEERKHVPNFDLDDFNVLDLGSRPSDSATGLELDTDKPHLSGAHQAVRFDDFDDRPLSRSGGSKPLSASGTSRRLSVSGAQPRADLNRSDSGASGAVPRTHSSGGTAIGGDDHLLSDGDPLARSAAGRRTSGAQGRVTGGFNAQRERNRRGTQRIARTLVTLTLLVIVGSAIAAGAILYLRHAGSRDAVRFAQGDIYTEHHLRLGESDAVRACAREPEESQWVCRYSREWYQEYFGNVPAAVLDRAPNACLGHFEESGSVARERLDCTLSSGADEVPVRLARLRERTCDRPLDALEEGETTVCRFSDAARVLPKEAEFLTAQDVVTAEVQYRRVMELNTDVGTLATREFMVRMPGTPGSYYYFAPSVGMFVRRALVAGAATSRVTYFEDDGQGRGVQVWPR